MRLFDEEDAICVIGLSSRRPDWAAPRCPEMCGLLSRCLMGHDAEAVADGSRHGVAPGARLQCGWSKATTTEPKGLLAEAERRRDDTDGPRSGATLEGLQAVR